MRIIILAQGDGDRWDFSERQSKTVYGFPLPYKHFLPIGEEFLIARTVRMLYERGYDEEDIYVISPTHFKEHIRDCTVISLDPVDSVLDRVLQTSMFWSIYGTTVLLGDVLFSHAVLDGLLGSEELIFAGRIGSNQITGKQPSELFGFTVLPEDYETVMYQLRDLLMRPLTHLGKHPRLWWLQRRMEDIVQDNTLLQCNDYTDDVDTPDEFHEFWPAMCVAALEDDRGPVK